MIWKPLHQQAVEQYYYCQSASTSASTRNELINTILYTAITKIVNLACRKINWQMYNDDMQQDITIHIINHTFNKLKPDKIRAAQQLIYLAARNKYLSYLTTIKKKKDKYTHTDISTAYDIAGSYDADNDINNEEIKRLIISKLNDKIRQERIINKSTTVFLLMLRDYLLENDFDERYFKTFIINKLNLSQINYKIILSRIGISSVLFKQKLVQDF